MGKLSPSYDRMRPQTKTISKPLSKVTKLNPSPDYAAHEETLKMYCLTCQAPICYLCDRFGKHESHHISELKSVYKDQRVSFKDGLDDGDANDNNVESKMMMF